MQEHGRRPVTLLAVAALLIVVGLVSAISAPGAPPTSNKADAYGGPVAPKPGANANRGACIKYYGSADNTDADARECFAIADSNAGNKKCAKKSGAAKAACKKAVKKRLAKKKAAIAAQRKAEKACMDKSRADREALDPEADDYSSKGDAIGEAYFNCMKRARGA
jgi:hypothetical protein